MSKRLDGAGYPDGCPDSVVPALSRRNLLFTSVDDVSARLAANLPAVRGLLRRARRLHWLNPEPRSHRGTGDSAARAYAALVDMHECRTVHQLNALVGRLLPV
ncbi:hypothetical protein GCM10010294_16780 [Streptomyces griseoloalbus]|nr:hypothetical protein GCM10010294_16780 [Streptomyces griseoloalbus]